jgi:hypothetical protein
VTLTLYVRIISSLIGGVYRLCNQGQALLDKDLNGSNETQILTVDPTPLAGAGTKTCVEVTTPPDIGLSLLSVQGLNVLWTGTSWRFDVQGTGIRVINVQVFRLTGERVYASGWVKNGHEWRPEDQTRKKLANGVYFYLVTVRGYDEKIVKTQVKKLIVAR